MRQLRLVCLVMERLDCFYPEGWTIQAQGVHGPFVIISPNDDNNFVIDIQYLDKLNVVLDSGVQIGGTRNKSYVIDKFFAKLLLRLSIWAVRKQYNYKAPKYKSAYKRAVETLHKPVIFEGDEVKGAHPFPEIKI